MRTSEPGRPAAAGSGARRSAPVGLLGGLMGLGGAEFRLPLLIGLFGLAALQAVILDKALSLVVVLTALPARSFAVPFPSPTSPPPGPWPPTSWPAA